MSVLAAAYIYAHLVLSLYPRTRPLAMRLLEMFLNPLGVMVSGRVPPGSLGPEPGREAREPAVVSSALFGLPPLLDLEYPKLDTAKRKELVAARAVLAREPSALR